MYKEIIDFWFNELEPKQWWQKDAVFDSTIKTRFGELHRQARHGELFKWRETALGSLAEIIILDQFSRNIYRDEVDSFACDSMALALAQFAISKGLDVELSINERAFMYMPFMHSESKLIHTQAVKLFEALGVESNLVPFPFSFEWLVHHKPGEVCSGLCLHQTTIQWMLSLYCA
ncbi:DUF924 domain-containing protein [Vibrio navarrensis]|uniref:DUF924 family protein n=1 Tax=Vibrio navarrensis TaxID=29495 RepID=UPI0009DD6A27|nr:DUF924 family protein [Vibrio navarrensis]QOD68570.1 DUF924 domain-containing protein [Vibrio navarrensis]